MPKKESYQRGMTKKEVYSKLDGLKTNEGKAKYLDKILSKKGLLTPETYKVVQESADEMYEKAAVWAAEERRFEYAGELAKKIGDKKLRDKVYGEVAMKAARALRGEFFYAEELAKKIGDKKLRDEVYGEVALEAARKGWSSGAVEFIWKIGNKKLANDIRKRLEKESKKK